MRETIKNTETDTVRIALIQRGWSYADIARRAGLSTRSFSTQLSGNFPNTLARAKVEAAFEYSVPIWCSIKTQAARKFCCDRFGSDPALVALPALRQLAERVNLPGWQAHVKKRNLLSAVLAHVTATIAHRVPPQKPPITIHRNEQHPTPKII